MSLLKEPKEHEFKMFQIFSSNFNCFAALPNGEIGDMAITFSKLMEIFPKLVEEWIVQQQQKPEVVSFDEWLKREYWVSNKEKTLWKRPMDRTAISTEKMLSIYKASVSSPYLEPLTEKMAQALEGLITADRRLLAGTPSRCHDEALSAAELALSDYNLKTKDK